METTVSQYLNKLETLSHEAQRMAKKQGVDTSTKPHNNEADAFRHAYISAKETRNRGSVITNIRGKLNEVKGAVIYGQSMDEWQMDEHNNAVGREIGRRAAQENWDDERIAREVKRSLDEDKLIIDPKDSQINQQKEKEFYDNPDIIWEKQPSSINTTLGGSSILDGIGNAVGAAGQAIAPVGSVAFDEAMSMGKDTLVHTITQATAQGGVNGKIALAGAAKIAMAQTLGRMHGLVMQEVERQQGSLFRAPGIAGPIPLPDGTTGDAIEKTINDPRNAGVFNDMATSVERTLKQVSNADPSAVVVEKVLDVLRGGNIKVQPHILVPDLLPQENGYQRQPKGNERVVEVAGISIPVKLPEVRVIDENGSIGLPSRTSDFNSNAGSLYRGANGAVEVRGYTRRDGTAVRGHSRSRPDDNLTHNFLRR